VLRKIKHAVRLQLRQGLSPAACSASIAASFTIGIFPIMGFSTLINTVVAFFFRLNQPVVQAFNWIVGPLKIALIFPFLRFGEWLFGAEPFSLSLTEFSKIFFEDWLATTREFAWTFVHAIAGWLVVAPVIFCICYWVARAVINRGSLTSVHVEAR